MADSLACAGGHPVNNRTTRYRGFGDDEAFNRGVRRYPAVAEAREYVRRNAELTGRVDDKVVMLSNLHDPTVPARFNQIYPGLVSAAGRSPNLAVLAAIGEGHCDLTAAQTTDAFFEARQLGRARSASDRAVTRAQEQSGEKKNRPS